MDGEYKDVLRKFYEKNCGKSIAKEVRSYPSRIPNQPRLDKDLELRFRELHEALSIFFDNESDIKGAYDFVESIKCI